MTNTSHLQRQQYSVPLGQQAGYIKSLQSSGDVNSNRLLHYLSLADLSRTKGSPVESIIKRIINVPRLIDFDLIDTPEIISSKVVFDLFNFPKDHVARSSSDTYYINDEYILRPHTSLMWKYYLDIPTVVEQIKTYGSAGVLSYGKTYRKDEVDWQHSNVFHQIDGLYIKHKDHGVATQKELEDVLIEIAQSLYGKDIQYRFNIDQFPYTDPSLEMEIAWGDEWIEILGGGIVHPNVVRNLGLDPEQYSGWAVGFGVDRLAMIKIRLPDIRLLRSLDSRVTDQLQDIDHIYELVSKYPPVIRDISFIVHKNEFDLNSYYEAVREVVGADMIEEVKLLDEYEDSTKFGFGKKSYTFRMMYRNLERTLTNAEVDTLHSSLELYTAEFYDAIIR